MTSRGQWQPSPLEYRLASLERWREQVEQRAQWYWYIGVTVLIGFEIPAVVYLAASLD